MNVKKFFRLFFKKRSEKVPQSQPSQLPMTRAYITEFDNLLNQITFELARPKLNPMLEVDEEKVRVLKQELIRALQR